MQNLFFGVSDEKIFYIWASINPWRSTSPLALVKKQKCNMQNFSVWTFCPISDHMSPCGSDVCSFSAAGVKCDGFYVYFKDGYLKFWRAAVKRRMFLAFSRYRINRTLMWIVMRRVALCQLQDTNSGLFLSSLQILNSKQSQKKLSKYYQTYIIYMFDIFYHFIE